MADDLISGVIGQVRDSAGSGVSTGGIGTGIIIAVGIFIAIALIAIVAAFVWWYWWDKKQWKIVTRVHYENPAINGITIGSPVPTKRVRFKDGRVVYMYKSPIQGYSISPELLTWTRPREHDVIVTQDKKLFCLVGIENIDVQRKMLKVDVSYPDIEMDRQDLQHHIDSKKFDDPNERFKVIAKVATWIFVMITIIVVVVIGTGAYNEGKAIDLERDRLNLEVSSQQTEVMEQVNTFISILTKVMPESFSNIDGQVIVTDGGS